MLHFFINSVSDSEDNSSKLPVITEHPQTQYAVYGDRIILSLSTDGPDTMSYQWQKDGVPINEVGYSSILHIDGFSPEHEGSYVCIVSNLFGSVQSEAAEIKGINYVVFVFIIML